MHPAFDDVFGRLRLWYRHDAVWREDGIDLAAGEDMGFEVTDDGLCDFALAFAERLAGFVRGLVDVDFRRPAKESVG